jgi:hypothetical protein
VRDTRPFRDWPFRRIDYIFVRFGEHGGGRSTLRPADVSSMSLWITYGRAIISDSSPTSPTREVNDQLSSRLSHARRSV